MTRSSWTPGMIKTPSRKMAKALGMDPARKARIDATDHKTLVLQLIRQSVQSARLASDELVGADDDGENRSRARGRVELIRNDLLRALGEMEAL